MSKKAPPFARKCEIAVNGPEIAYARFYFSSGNFHAFSIKIDFRGIVDNFNAIPAPNLQSEMQKPIPHMEPAHFFVLFLIFRPEEFFPQRLVNTAFYSPTVGATCFFVIEKFL